MPAALQPRKPSFYFSLNCFSPKQLYKQTESPSFAMQTSVTVTPSWLALNPSLGQPHALFLQCRGRHLPSHRRCCFLFQATSAFRGSCNLLRLMNLKCSSSGCSPGGPLVALGVFYTSAHKSLSIPRCHQHIRSCLPSWDPHGIFTPTVRLSRLQPDLCCFSKNRGQRMSLTAEGNTFIYRSVVALEKQRNTSSQRGSGKHPYA